MGLVFNLADGDNARIVGRTIGSYQDTNGNYEGVPVDNLRASSATEINKDGLIQEVGVDVLRFDYSENPNGDILTEDEGSQLMNKTEDISDSYWSKAGLSPVTSTTQQSPIKDVFYDKITDDTSTGLHGVSRSNFPSGVQRVHSWFVKKGSIDIVRLADRNNTINYSVWFDLSNGVVLTQESNVMKAGIKENDYGYRIHAVFTGASTSVPSLYLADADNSKEYTGSGNGYIYAIGANLIDGNLLTTYIKDAETRAADTGITTGDISHLINSQEGVLKVKIKPKTPSTMYVSLNGGVNSRVYFRYTSSGNVAFEIRVGGVAVYSFFTSANYLEPEEYTFKYKSGDVGVKINGIEVDTSSDTFTFIDSLNTFELSRENGSSQFFGRTSYVKIYDSADDY